MVPGLFLKLGQVDASRHAFGAPSTDGHSAITPSLSPPAFLARQWCPFSYSLPLWAWVYRIIGIRAVRPWAFVGGRLRHEWQGLCGMDGRRSGEVPLSVSSVGESLKVPLGEALPRLLGSRAGAEKSERGALVLERGQMAGPPFPLSSLHLLPASCDGRTPHSLKAQPLPTGGVSNTISAFMLTICVLSHHTRICTICFNRGQAGLEARSIACKAKWRECLHSNSQQSITHNNSYTI